MSGACAITPDPLTLAQATEIVNAYTRACPRVWLYAIQHGDAGPIKLGTAKSPRKRLAALQIGSPVTLNGIAAWRCLPGDEEDIHALFDDAWVRGEWYWPTQELLDLVLREGGDFCDWDA